MPVVQDINWFDMHGNHIAGLATKKRGASQIMMWRGTTAAGSATPPHTHDHEEVLAVLSGSGTFVENGQQAPMKAGDVYIVAANTVPPLIASGRSQPHDGYLST